MTKLPLPVGNYPIISHLQTLWEKTSRILGCWAFFKLSVCYLGQSNVVNRWNTCVMEEM